MAKRDFGKRPKCIYKNCNRDAQFMGTYHKDGTPIFRKICYPHHGSKIAKKHGVSSIREVTAKNHGFSDINEYLNSIHPYRKYRKDYCENIDGRLGFRCTTTILFKAQLEVDHINGHHNDDRKGNHQTFCADCHVIKGILKRKGKL